MKDHLIETLAIAKVYGHRPSPIGWEVRMFIAPNACENDSKVRVPARW